MTEKQDIRADSQSAAFQQAAGRKQGGVLREFGRLLMHNKKWWLAPIIIILLLVAVLVLLSGTALSPFIYTLH